MSAKSVIIITKFDNPYQFWFRRREYEDKRRLCEESWTQTMRNAVWNKNYKAGVGNKVLIKQDNFKRALIQQIAGKMYTCWLLDEGVAITADQIYQMNADMALMPSFAIQGGINNIIPMEMKYNFTRFQHDMQFTRHWSQGSIKVCRVLISEATSVVFIREIVQDDVEYGQILLSDKCGIPTSLTMELVENKFAVVDQQGFQKKINSSELYDDATLFDDGLSLMTTPVLDESLSYNRIIINTNREREVAKPSGLSRGDIKFWLSKTEEATKCLSTIDSDDSLKPSIEVKSPEKSRGYSQLQTLLKERQIHKHALNVTDLNIQSTSNTTGAIRKQTHSTQDFFLKSADCAQTANTVSTDKPECDWTDLDSSIIEAKGSSPSKIEPFFDTSNFYPAGYNLSKRSNPKSDRNCKARKSDHSTNSSSFNRPVTSNYEQQQRRFTDSYQFDRRPKPCQQSQQRRSLQQRRNDLLCSNDSSSLGKRVILRSSKKRGEVTQRTIVNDNYDPNFGQDDCKKSFKTDSVNTSNSSFDDRDCSSLGKRVILRSSKKRGEVIQRTIVNDHFDPTSGQADSKSSLKTDNLKTNGNSFDGRASDKNCTGLCDLSLGKKWHKTITSDKFQNDSCYSGSVDNQLDKEHSCKIVSEHFNRSDPQNELPKEDDLSYNSWSWEDGLKDVEVGISDERLLLEKKHSSYSSTFSSKSESHHKSYSDSIGLTQHTATTPKEKKFLKEDDPAYDSWEDDDVNEVKIGISDEKELMAKRDSSLSPAFPSESQSFQKSLKLAQNTQTTVQHSKTINQSSASQSDIKTYGETDIIRNYPTIKNSMNNSIECVSRKSTTKCTSSKMEPANKVEFDKYMKRLVCQCPNCEPWNDSEDLGPELGLQFIDDEGRQSNSRKELKKRETVRVIKEVEVKPERLFRSEDDKDGDDRQNIMFETIASTQATLNKEGTRMKRIKVPPVLVHCNMLPTPSPTLATVSGFIPSVIEALRKHGYRDAKPLQIYGWPAATNGAHVLLVGGPGTGKTLGHVPTVASAILGDVVRATGQEKWGREREPTVMILCTGSKKCDEVYDLYCKLVGKCDNNRRLNIALAIPPLDKQYQDQFKNKVDILITTPLILCKLITKQVLNLKSLNILILEDLDILLNHFQKEMTIVERLVTSMLGLRTFSESVQLFMTSEHWTYSINKFLSRLKHLPFICIMDPMETAFYGKAKAQVHIIEGIGKPYHLKELLKDNYHLFKTVVVCNAVSEIADIEDIFRVHAISFTTATSEMEGQEIINVEIEWDSTVPGDHKILLCDDSSLMNYFSIRNANTLVHFSLPPDSWKMFTQRFRCMFDSYTSPLLPSTNKAKCQVHIYLNDKCHKQLSRLINCFKQMGCTIPDTYIEMAEHAHIQNERLKLTTTTPICRHLKLTGQCLTPTRPCHHRHMFDHRVDRSKQKYGHLPQYGPVMFRLLNVVDATTYYVRLLDQGNVDWKRSSKEVRGGEVDKEYGKLLVEMQVALKIEGNRVRPQGGPKVGGCFILEDSNSLRRCRVTKIIETDRITSAPTIVEAFLVDDGVLSSKVVAERLFAIPKNIKIIPYLAVEVCLANIVPPGRDSAFSIKIKADIQHLLAKHSSNTPTTTENSTPHYYTGVVQLQLGNCLWLDDVRLMRYLRKTDIHLTSLILKNEIIGNFWGEWDETPMKRLKQLCTERNLSVPNIPEAKLKKRQQIVEQIAPQWAFFEADSWNKVNFSSGEKLDCIYVNLEKFKKQLSDLHSYILQQIKRPFYPLVGEIIVGRYYLAPDTNQEDTDMCRVLVTDLKDEKNGNGAPEKVAQCFLVDYGNTEYYNIKALKYLRDDMITQLPFQAIECSFHGLPSLNDNNNVIDIIYNEYYLEYDTDFYRTWYARVVNKHTVYNPCSSFQNKSANLGENDKVTTNLTSRSIYSIHSYLEDKAEIVSLNFLLFEKIETMEIIDAQNINMDNLEATEEMQEDLINMIVRERREIDLDEEWQREGGEKTVEVTNDNNSIEKVSLEVKYSPEETSNGMAENTNSWSQNVSNLNDFNEDDDIQIMDKTHFIKQFRENSKPKQSKLKSLPAPVLSNTLGYTPMVAVPVVEGDSTLTPEVLWHQTSKHIVLEVQIPAVVKYKVILLRRNMLTFSANINSKKYSLQLHLLKSVKNLEHKALGLYVQIKLLKLDEEEWPRLVLSKDKRPFIKYNIFKIEPEYNEDDDDLPARHRKRFLDLGPEFADIPQPEPYWYQEDSDYDNSESDYAPNEFAD